MPEIVDRVYDDGELQQFLVYIDGMPEMKPATGRNKLLFDPEDELSVDGLYDFAEGNESLRLSDEFVIESSATSYSYRIYRDDFLVETSPEISSAVLNAVYEALTGNLEPIEELYKEVRENQVNQSIVNPLRSTFPHNRIDIRDDGWYIDDFYVVTWDAEIHINRDLQDYVRQFGKAVSVETNNEFITLQQTGSVPSVSVTINGTTVTLSEIEVEFLGKVKWLLNRRHYHPNRSFWMRVDRHASVDWKSGTPTTDETFNL